MTPEQLRDALLALDTNERRYMLAPSSDAWNPDDIDTTDLSVTTFVDNAVAAGRTGGIIARYRDLLIFQSLIV